MPGDLLGQILADRYRVEVLLGEGTFARVYRVTDLHRRAQLAAKVLRSEIAHDPTLIERFRREANVLERLQHPNIVRYYGFVNQQSVVFFLLEYIPGQTLESTLLQQKGPFKPTDVLPYITPLASALHYAHVEGVVHRDLKPANVLVHENGTLYVSDFGIARLLNTTSELTMGMSVGTPYYMSPEQINGDPVSPATDVYALGILLYRMLTGLLPFRGETPQATGTSTAARVTYEQLHTPPVSPTLINQSLDLSVEDVLLRCLEKNPTRRYPSISAFYDAFVEAVGAPPIDLAPGSDSRTSATNRPAVKLPEWSQFLTPPPSSVEDLIADDIVDDVEPLPPPPDRIQHPIPQPPTRPHLEAELQAAIRTQINPGHASPSPATIPSLRPVAAQPAPPGYIAPPYSPPPRRTVGRWSLAIIVFGVLLVAAVLCIAVIYLNQSNGTSKVEDSIQTPDITNFQPSEITPETTYAVPSQGGTRIAFDSRRTGNLDIYIMNVDGSGLQQITGTSGAERGPSWSPDGRQIAFYGAASENGNFDIYTINTDGTGLFNVTNSPEVDDRYPSWSPDGARIAFHSNADGDYDIYAINTDGTGLQAITHDDADDLGPDWSPDGTRIAFHTNQWSELYAIAVIDLRTEVVTRLTTDTQTDTFPTWSPDGTRLAYNAIDPRTGIVIVALLAVDGTGSQPVTSAQDGNSAFADWSPDGSQLVFQRGGDTQSTLYILSLANNESKAITGSQGNFLPEWEPLY